MRHNSLKLNAILNMVRRGSAIVFPFVTFSLASHRMGADRIGAYSFVFSIISYFLLLASLGISTYAVREGQEYRNKPEELSKFVSEVYTINLIMTAISYVVLGILFLCWNKLTNYSGIVWILSISIVLTTVGADWINTLMEDYIFITVRYIIVQCSCFIMIFCFIHTPDDILKYAVIGMLSSAGGNLLNIFYVRKKVSFHITCYPNIKQHIRPMLTLFANSLAVKVYVLADVTILGIWMSDTDIGYYTAAAKVYTAIKEMVNALILVTVPRFSLYLAQHDHKRYYNVYHKVYNSVITVVLPAIVGLFFQAENILYYLGGADYIAGKTSLRILSLSIFFAVGGCLFSQSIMIPNKKENAFLFVTVISALINIILNFIMIPFWGIEAAAITTLISEIIIFIYTLYKSKPLVEGVIQLSNDVKSSILGAVGVATVCIIVSLFPMNHLINMLISVCASLIIYLLIMLGFGNNTIVNLISRVIKKKR